MVALGVANTTFRNGQSIYLLYLFYRLKIDEDETAAKVLELAVEAAQKTASHHEIPARCILNVGGEYTLGPVTIGLDIHNLLGVIFLGCSSAIDSIFTISRR